jgi:pimeloyl-ACP methyl ester carboxylesterase
MMNDQTTDPEELLRQCEATAIRVETPCGEGSIVWRIWGDEHRDALPLVLGHGGQGTWNHWIRNIDALAARYRVIIPDLPGHGDSAMPTEVRHTAISAALAGGMPALLGETGKAIFVGFSFAGAVFTHFAMHYPERVERLIVVGTGGLDTPHGKTNIGRLTGLKGEERTEMMRSNLLGLMLHHRETVDDLALHMLIANARSTRLPLLHLVMPDRVVQVLDRVPAPVDAIWGEFDRPHPDPGLQESVLRRFKPDLDFRVVKDAGHWVMYERAEAFNAELLDLLDKPPRR